jgi:hypothetical protein
MRFWKKKRVKKIKIRKHKKRAKERINILLIGEEHLWVNTNFRRPTHIKEIKKFNATRILIEECNTKSADPLCKAMNLGLDNKRILRKLVENYYEEIVKTAIEHFEKNKQEFLERYFSKNERACFEDYMQYFKKHKKSAIKEHVKYMSGFLENLAKEQEELDLHFIDMKRRHVWFLKMLLDYCKTQKVGNKNATKKLRRKVDELDDKLNKSISNRAKDYKIFKNTAELLQDRTVVILGRAHTKYFYEKLKKLDKYKYVIEHIYINENGRKGVKHPNEENMIQWIIRKVKRKKTNKKIIKKIVRKGV